ncbi:MAG TPA: hypothetical protein VFI12_04035, partial [Thermomicrobiales bacterium]|nr:hypothetical protein [Thermomicrobiales bacterium]
MVLSGSAGRSVARLGSETRVIGTVSPSAGHVPSATPESIFSASGARGVRRRTLKPLAPTGGVPVIAINA